MFFYVAYLFNLMNNPTKYNVLSLYLKGVWSYGDHKISPYQTLSGKVTKKRCTQICVSCKQHAFSTTCTILPSIINIYSYRKGCLLSQSQGFYYQILSGEITKKTWHLQLQFLYVKPSQPCVESYQIHVASIYLKQC